MYEQELARFAEALSSLAQNSPDAREALGALGALLDQISGSSSGDGSPPPPAYSGEVVVRDRLNEGYLGSTGGARPDDGEHHEWEPRASVALDLISERCRLKAEACRWSIERRRLLEAGDGYDERVGPRDAELIERARSLENCFAWSLHPQAELPDDEFMEVVAGNYEGLAVVVETMLEVDELTKDRDRQQEAMQMVAAAQSALRQALFDAGRKQRDTDQEDAFHWLKQQTGLRRIYVARHMRLMDPADPLVWEERNKAAERLVEQLSSSAEQSSEAQSHLNRIRYHVDRVDAGDGDLHDWERINETVAALIEECEMQPSDEALCEALELAVDLVPEDFEPGAPLRLALSETEAWLDTFEDEDEESDDLEDEETGGEQDEATMTDEEESVTPGAEENAA